MYCCATWVLGVQPHQVMLAEVAFPAPPPLLPPPPAQAASRKTSRLRIGIAGNTRRLRLSFRGAVIVPPGPELPTEPGCRCLGVPLCRNSCVRHRLPGSATPLVAGQEEKLSAEVPEEEPGNWLAGTFCPLRRC